MSKSAVRMLMITRDRCCYASLGCPLSSTFIAGDQASIFWTCKIANCQSLAFSERGYSAIPRGTNVAQMNANWVIQIAAQRTQRLWGPIPVISGGIWVPTNAIVIQIAAIALASDSAITIAWFRPSKVRVLKQLGQVSKIRRHESSGQLKLCLQAFKTTTNAEQHHLLREVIVIPATEHTAGRTVTFVKPSK